MAFASLALMWWVWAAWNPGPDVNDERSYLLQAEIFSSGRWTASQPPVPDFFQQPHVLVEPAVASKYPPGHALALTGGVFLHFPPLIPLLLTACTGALVFVLARRLGNPIVGLLSWVVWITTPIVLRFQPSYFSELSTTALMLTSWYCVLRWREQGRTRWLVATAVAAAAGAITRPLTMLALCIPLGAVLLVDIARRRQWRSWRQLAVAALAGMTLLAVIPLWSRQTTGSWRLTPLELYRRDYLPFDRWGFDIDYAPPRRELRAPTEFLYRANLPFHESQTFEKLPHTAMARIRQLRQSFFPPERLPLAFMAIAGLLAGPAAHWVATAAVIALFLAYLPYAHQPSWTLYYLETAPVVAFLVAYGVWAVAVRLLKDDKRSKTVVAAAAMVVALAAMPSVLRWHRAHGHSSAAERRDLIAAVPPGLAIVFAGVSTNSRVNHVFNPADLSLARVWFVHDLGERNAELRRLAPDRAAYRLGADGRLTSLDRVGLPVEVDQKARQ